MMKRLYSTLPAVAVLLSLWGLLPTWQAARITPEQREEFRAATSGLRVWYAERYGQEWLDRLDAAVAACEQQTGDAG